MGTKTDWLADKIIKGAIIGTVGALVQELYHWVLQAFGYQGLTYLDYGKTILSLNLLTGTIGSVMGLAAHLLWDIIVGVGFVCLIHWSSGFCLQLKGIIYGLSIWFLVQAGVSLFRLPELLEAYPHSEPVIFIGSIFYGLVVGYTYKLLAKRRLHQNLAPE